MTDQLPTTELVQEIDRLINKQRIDNECLAFCRSDTRDTYLFVGAIRKLLIEGDFEEFPLSEEQMDVIFNDIQTRIDQISHNLPPAL